MKKSETEFLKQKEIVKQYIDDCESYVLFTDSNVSGYGSLAEIYGILANGVINMVKNGKLPKFLTNELANLISADNIDEYMKNRIEELKIEEEE